MSSLIIYNIRHPVMENDTRHESVDPQVNGIGLYRTVGGGVEPLLIHRIRFPEKPAYVLTTPADMAPFRANVTTGEENDTLYPMMSFRRVDQHGDWLYTINSYAWATSADRAAILAGFDTTTTPVTPALIQGIGHMVTHQSGDSSSNPSFCIHQWESESQAGLTPSTDNIVKGTFRWEGVNSNHRPTANFIFLVPQQAGGSPVRFWSAERINNSPYETTLGTAKTPSIVTMEDSTRLQTLETRLDVFCTQVWEVGEGNPELDEDVSDQDGPIQGEDATGRHATYSWEIDLYDIRQSWYWTFQDSTPDDLLGEAVEIDNDVPPPGNLLASFQEHMFLAGDPDNPHYLRWSKRFRPESWPVDQFIEVGTPNDPITKLSPITGVLGVFTRATKYRVAGNNTSGFVHDEAVSHRGTSSPRSVVPTDQGVLFASRDGVFTTNFLGPDRKISDAIDSLFIGETKSEYKPINWNAVDQLAAGFYKNKYYLSYPSGIATVNDMTAVYSFDTEQWTFWDVGFASFYREHDTNLFLAGGTDSLVYVIEDPATNTDDGVDISMELHTRNFFGSSRTTKNLFLYFKVDANCDDGEMTATFFVDDVAISTQTITGDRTCQLLSLPENTFGKRWRMKVAYEGDRRVAIYGVTSVFIPLMTA